MEPSKSLAQLKKVISEMTLQLETYSKKENASTGFIDRQNIAIGELVAVYNCFSKIQVKPHLLILEAEIARLERLDSNLSGHQIVLRTKPTGHHFSVIHYNIYDNA